MSVTEELAYALHGAVWDYSQTDGWPIVSDDLAACEVLASAVVKALAEAGYRIVHEAEVESQHLVISERRNRDTLRWPAYAERERAEYALLFGAGVLIREERTVTPWREVERLETADEYRVRMDAEDEVESNG